MLKKNNFDKTLVFSKKKPLKGEIHRIELSTAYLQKNVTSFIKFWDVGVKIIVLEGKIN